MDYGAQFGQSGACFSRRKEPVYRRVLLMPRETVTHMDALERQPCRKTPRRGGSEGATSHPSQPYSQKWRRSRRALPSSLLETAMTPDT